MKLKELEDEELMKAINLSKELSGNTTQTNATSALDSKPEPTVKPAPPIEETPQNTNVHNPRSNFRDQLDNTEGLFHHHRDYAFNYGFYDDDYDPDLQLALELSREVDLEEIKEKLSKLPQTFNTPKEPKEATKGLTKKETPKTQISSHDQKNSNRNYSSVKNPKNNDQQQHIESLSLKKSKESERMTERERKLREEQTKRDLTLNMGIQGGKISTTPIAQDVSKISVLSQGPNSSKPPTRKAPAPPIDSPSHTPRSTSSTSGRTKNSPISQPVENASSQRPSSASRSNAFVSSNTTSSTSSSKMSAPQNSNHNTPREPFNNSTKVSPRDNFASAVRPTRTPLERTGGKKSSLMTSPTAQKEPITQPRSTKNFELSGNERLGRVDANSPTYTQQQQRQQQLGAVPNSRVNSTPTISSQNKPSESKTRKGSKPTNSPELIPSPVENLIQQRRSNDTIPSNVTIHPADEYIDDYDVLDMVLAESRTNK